MYVKIHYRNGTLKFEKISDYGPPKSAVYNTTVWAEATLQFNDWKEYFQNEKAAKRAVFNDYYFVSSIWAKNGVRYSGIHRLNSLGEIIPKTGLNLDNFEWINVMKKVEEINLALYGSQAIQGEKRSSVNEVQVWGYRWLLNGNEVEMKDELSKIHTTLKYYSEEEARTRGNQHKPDLKLKEEDELLLEVIPEYVSRPSELLQMRMILQHVAKSCADINREMNCPACQNDPPSSGQVSHMQRGGCLYNREFRDYGDEVTEDVYSVIESEDLIALYNVVCKKMDVPYSGSALMGRAIMAWLSRDSVTDTMTEEEEMSRDAFTEEDKKGFTNIYAECENPVIAPANWPLKYLINKVYFDLNMHPYLQKKLAAKKLRK